MPLRTNWEHFMTNTSHGPGLFCPSPGKKKKQMNEKKIGKRKEKDDI